MIKYVYTIFLSIGLVTANAKSKEVSGIIITLNNDTIHTVFEIPVRSNGQPRFDKLVPQITYIDKRGNKNVLVATEAKEVQFQLPGQPLERIVSHIPKTLAPSRMAKNGFFLRLIEDGNVRLMEWHSSKWVEIHFRKTEGGAVIFKNDFGIPKQMLIGLFDDCPALQKKLRNNEYNLKTLREIAQYYNKNCAQ